MLQQLEALATPSQGITPTAAQPVPSDKSIAVLPFTNMSADPDAEYFSDGMTEEIINALSQLSELSVAARTSSFAFTGKTPDIALERGGCSRV